VGFLFNLLEGVYISCTGIDTGSSADWHVGKSGHPIINPFFNQ